MDFFGGAVAVGSLSGSGQTEISLEGGGETGNSLGGRGQDSFGGSCDRGVGTEGSLDGVVGAAGSLGGDVSCFDEGVGAAGSLGGVIGAAGCLNGEVGSFEASVGAGGSFDGVIGAAVSLDGGVSSFDEGVGVGVSLDGGVESFNEGSFGRGHTAGSVTGSGLADICSTGGGVADISFVTRGQEAGSSLGGTGLTDVTLVGIASVDSLGRRGHITGASEGRVVSGNSVTFSLTDERGHVGASVDDTGKISFSCLADAGANGTGASVWASTTSGAAFTICSATRVGITTESTPTFTSNSVGAFVDSTVVATTAAGAILDTLAVTGGTAVVASTAGVGTEGASVVMGLSSGAIAAGVGIGIGVSVGVGVGTGAVVDVGVGTDSAGDAVLGSTVTGVEITSGVGTGSGATDPDWVPGTVIGWMLAGVTPGVTSVDAV